MHKALMHTSLSFHSLLSVYTTCGCNVGSRVIGGSRYTDNFRLNLTTTDYIFESTVCRLGYRSAACFYCSISCTIAISVLLEPLYILSFGLQLP